jgi:transketolase
MVCGKDESTARHRGRNMKKGALSPDTINRLEKKARELRYLIVRTSYEVGSERKAHPGPALSIADLMVALFYQVMRINPKDPKRSDRDRFILSKGHACLALYAALADLGYFPKENLSTVRHIGSMLQGHPDMRKTPGVDMTAGSLGNGLGAGVGMALGARLDKMDYSVYVQLGDGELDEGVVWEAAASASKYALDNLVAIVDQNRFQSCGATEDIMPLGDIAKKWEAFGWITRKIDGHNMKDILSSLYWARRREERPKVIIAHTIKGKGVSFMENNNDWHQKVLTPEEMRIAEQELTS